MSELPTLGEVCEMLGKTNTRKNRRRLASRLERIGKRIGTDLLIHNGRCRSCQVRWDEAETYIRPRRSAVEGLTGPEWDKLFEVVAPISGMVADQKIETRVIPWLIRLENRQETEARAIRRVAESLSSMSKTCQTYHGVGQGVVKSANQARDPDGQPSSSPEPEQAG